MYLILYYIHLFIENYVVDDLNVSQNVEVRYILKLVFIIYIIHVQFIINLQLGLNQ